MGGGKFPAQERLIATTPIISEQLTQGQLLHLWWHPNSRCLVRHECHSRFTIVEAENTCLLAGDTFISPAFIPHEPLYLYDLTHQGRTSLLYVVGSHDGIMLADYSPHHET